VGDGMVYMDETDGTALVANGPGARCLTDDFLTVKAMRQKKSSVYYLKIKPYNVQAILQQYPKFLQDV
jgi:hypothetical protein